MIVSRVTLFLSKKVKRFRFEFIRKVYLRLITTATASLPSTSKGLSVV